MTYGTPTGRLAVITALIAVPWTVVLIGGEYTFVFGFGLFNTNPPQLVTLYDFLFRFTLGPTALPEYLLAWPTGVLLYAGALVSAAGGVVGYEDRRVTAGLLIFAGLTQVSVALGLSRVVGRFAIPFGTVCLWAVVWWFYGPDLYALVPASRGE